MRRLFLIAAVLFVVVRCPAAENNFSVPIRKSEIGSKPRTTDAPTGPLMGAPTCGADNSIYIRYFPVGTTGSSFTAGIAKIDSAGRFKQLSPARIPNLPDALEIFQFAVASDGKFYEIVHQLEQPDDRPGGSVTYLAVFSKEGSFISNHALQVNVFPNFMVPLDNGDVFMGGTQFEEGEAGVTRKPFLGIFSGDGSLKYSIKRPDPKLTEADKEQGSVDPALHRGSARLGPDGNVYLLLAGDPLRVQVFSPSAKLVREFVIDSPLRQAKASGLYVSQGRLLLPMYGQDETGKNNHAWVVYDSQTGKPISAVEPVGRIGTPVCWEDGKRLQFLVVNTSTSQFEIATADIE